MEKCFIIQPFDKDKFEQRYSDIFEPSILKADFEPYRIDRDLSVRIPIDEIEKGIVECAICFAEITTDNPNVWYELGYAFACKKDVVLVCSDERTAGKFPFDIQHRQIINYKTSSLSDFQTLGETITKKIKALIQTSKTVEILKSSPVIETEGLKSHEIALLILMMENQISEFDSTPSYIIKQEMNKAGYTNIATSVGMRTLTKYGMIETFKVDTFENGESYQYIACRLTAEGEGWILTNQDQLEFRASKTNNNNNIIIDDLPF